VESANALTVGIQNFSDQRLKPFFIRFHFPSAVDAPSIGKADGNSAGFS
jgi:hypothetical protein